MRIRAHEPTDHAQLAELRWLLKAGDHPAASDDEREVFCRDYCEQLRESDGLGDTVHWVIEDDRQLVGGLTIRIVRKELSPGRDPGKWGYVTNTFVRAEWRGRSLGSDLLHRAIAWATKERLELLIVWPSELNYPFYRRAGFRGDTDPLELVLPLHGD